MAFIAIIAWFGLVLQFKLAVGNTAAGYTTAKLIINFFSYFTVLCNLFVAISLTFSLLSPSSAAGKFFLKVTVQSAIAVYIFIVGLVYNLVLRNVWEPKGWQLVADNLLHVIVPLLYVLYWFIFIRRRQLKWRDMYPWLLFPALYLAYSLIRGPIANWYPYPFVDVAKFGYGKVAINSLCVLAAILLVSSGAIAWNRRGTLKESESKL